MIYIGSSWDPLDRIAETVDNLRYLASLNIGDEAIFEGCEFARPISIAPLAIRGYCKNLVFENTPDYFHTVSFPGGQEISGYTREGDTYFPITRADLNGLNDEDREKKLRELSDKYASLLRRNIITDEEFISRIGGNVSHLLITEMIDNIHEHANADHAFIFSQYYRNSDFCEICLADNGDGIFKSLLNAGRNVQSDLDAIQKVILEALSAKDEFGSTKRGTGIRNTINLLSNNELNGFFCVISGKVGYFVDSRERDQFIDFRNFNWEGTIVNMGFRKPQQTINIYEYIR